MHCMTKKESSIWTSDLGAKLTSHRMVKSFIVTESEHAHVLLAVFPEPRKRIRHLACRVSCEYSVHSMLVHIVCWSHNHVLIRQRTARSLLHHG